MAAQLRQPHGWFGSLVVSRMMNRINRQIIDATLGQIELAPHHQVLEIGFGGGVALQLLAERLSKGMVTGVDISPDMLQQAERRFRKQIAAGRVRILPGNVSHLPFPDATFDRVFTINTVYFWPDAGRGMAEIRRVLKDGGQAAVSIRSKEKMEKHAVTKYDFRLFTPQAVVELMQQAGFRDVRVDHRDREKWYDQAIIVGSV